jgi:hydroxyethylthiazole kinase-like uncharacterized protein yjeF
MYKFVSVAEMVAVEKAANASGFSYAQMMENAGTALAEVVNAAYSHIQEKKICGLVGKGNNGGDTLVALAALAEWGWQTCAYIVGGRGQEDELSARLEKAGGLIYQDSDDKGFKKLSSLVQEGSLLLDGLLGTGIHLPLHPPVPEVLRAVAEAIRTARQAPAVVAVDCPSGVDCDSGEAAEETLKAEITVSMAAVKRGLLAFPAFNYVGTLEMVGIGLPEGFPALEAIRRFMVDEQYAAAHMPPRPLDSHKGTYGTALIVAGSRNYTGAPVLAGQAAYRCGTGLITLAVPEPLQAMLAGKFTEATWLPLPHRDGAIAGEAAQVVLSNLHRVTAMLVGPGFGLADCSRDFIEELTKAHELPSLVFDADGLKLLAQVKDWYKRLPGVSVLTPHPGEMSVLTGLSVPEIQSKRIETAERYAKEWGQVVILKGAFTIVASPTGETAVIPIATPALAKAGTGDVLAGLVVGLRAQGVEAFPAAVTAAWVHGQAGLIAAKRLAGTAGVLAGDLVRFIPCVLPG